MAGFATAIEDLSLDLPPAPDAESRNEEDKAVRSERADYLYDAFSEFNQPLILRGTNRVLRRNHLGLKDVRIEDLVERTSTLEETFEMIKIRDFGELKFLGSASGFLLFATPEGTNIAVEVHTLDSQKPQVTRTFGQVCAGLSIPAPFAAKLPEEINAINFDYLLEKRALEFLNDPKKMRAIDVLLSKELLGFQIKDQAAITAKQVLNFYPIPGKNSVDVVRPMTEVIPLLGNILKSTVGKIQETMPNGTIEVKNFTPGYRGENRGVHHVELFLPDATVMLQGEVYKPRIQIRADFGGTVKDLAGFASFSFQFVRQVCDNGLCIPLHAEQREALAQQFKTMAKYNSMDPALLEAKLDLLFRATSFNLPLSSANAGGSLDMIETFLDFIAFAPAFLEARLNALTASLDSVDPEEFITIVQGLVKTLDLKSPIMVNMFLQEYVAGVVTGRPSFTNAGQILQYLTFLSQAFDPWIRADMELKAYRLAYLLNNRMAAVKTVEQSAFTQIVASLSSDLLAKETGPNH